MSVPEVVNDILAKTKFAGAASTRMIESAEDELGVKFPPSFREFLAGYGAVCLTGFRIAGLFATECDEEPPFWDHVVVATQQVRRGSQGYLPNGYIVIADDGGDYMFYLDTASCRADGECPVVVLGPGVDAIVVAEDFFDFVVRVSEDRIRF